MTTTTLPAPGHTVADGAGDDHDDPNRRWIHVGRRAGGWLFALIVVVGFWWLLSVSGIVDSALFPGPGAVFEAARAMWDEGVLGSDITVSLARALSGFVIGASLGIVVGFLTGRIPLIARVVTPVVSFLRPIPVIALVPLATAWFGIGEDAKRIVVSYAVFLAVWLYVHDGVARIPDLYLRVSRMLGVSRVRTLFTVLVPAAAPEVVTALRYGSSIAFLALVAAELGGTQQGIAYRIQVDGQFMQTDRMFVGLIVLGALGASADALIAFAGRRLIRWGN